MIQWSSISKEYYLYGLQWIKTLEKRPWGVVINVKLLNEWVILEYVPWVDINYLIFKTVCTNYNCTFRIQSYNVIDNECVPVDE